MSEENDYLKQRYKNGSGNYILMLIVAAIFLALGIGLAVIIIKDNAPLGLIFDIPCLGFGFGFGFYAIKTLSLKIRSIRLIDSGKSGTGYFVRFKTVYYKGGRAHQKHCIVFRYTNDSGIEKDCTTDYVFVGDEIQGLKSGAALSIKYSDTFAVVVDLIKAFQEASYIAKQGGKEFLNNDRTFGTIEPKANKFLNIAGVVIIALIVIFIALMVTSMVTKINTFIIVGAGLLGVGFVTFGISFSVVYFGNSSYKPEMGVFVYKCKPTGKVYLGCGTSLEASIKLTTSFLNNGIFSSNSKHGLQKAWKKYGESSFEIFVLELLKYDDYERKKDYKPELYALRETCSKQFTDFEFI